MSLANSRQPYRSTICTDFITKTLPYHSQPDESVTSNLGPSPPLRLYRHHSHDDRILLDKTLFIPFFCIFPWSGCRHRHLRRQSAETLRTLNRWWSEFCAPRPLSDEEMEEYCLVVAGNKTDLAPSSTGLFCLRRGCVRLHRRTRPAVGIPI
jgi:Ras-related protein Rab-7A